MNETPVTAPRVGLLCVGSELLRGKINTHGSTLARRLATIGLELGEEQTIGDSLGDLVQAIRHALPRFEIIILTGGLGPTFDDVTREAVAEATGLRLETSNVLLRQIQAKFKKAKYRMPEANARQAQLVRGAKAIENSVGTAPGQWLDLAGEQVIVLLPGPPTELLPMVDRFVLPALSKRFPRRPQAEAHLHFVGAPESVVDERVRPLIAKAEKTFGGDAVFTILAHLGLVDLDIYVAHDDAKQASRAVDELASAVRKTMGDYFYGMNDAYPLERVVQEHFRKNAMTLSLAESCTGGLLAARLTEIPGSSHFLLGSVVSYSNEMKTASLGVPADQISRKGAVSASVAAAMAEGARKMTGSTYALAITGIAGPDGGTPSKPVGLVYIGVAGPAGTEVQEYHLKGNRDTIRQRAVLHALDWLRRL